MQPTPMTRPGQPTPTEVQFRVASEDDCVSLAVLADAASRRLMSWTWDAKAAPGQSSFEVGREIIRSDTSSPSHRSSWIVAEYDGGLAGGLNSYRMPPAEQAAAASSETAEVLRPLTDLKAAAEGTWYVAVASVFPEFRGKGIGWAILGEAAKRASVDHADKVTLLVASFNHDARRLYERLGFYEWQRRPFVPFQGSNEAGDWILMAQNLA